MRLNYESACAFSSWIDFQKGRIENHDQTEAVVRKFLIEELLVSPTQVDAIKFSNAHRLPRTISAVNSEDANNSENVERSSDNQQ